MSNPNMSETVSLPSNPLVLNYQTCVRERKRIEKLLGTRSKVKQAFLLAQRIADLPGATVEQMANAWNLEAELNSFKELSRAKKLAILDEKASKEAIRGTVNAVLAKK
jgi:hypothetical protein